MADEANDISDKDEMEEEADVSGDAMGEGSVSLDLQTNTSSNVAVESKLKNTENSEEFNEEDEELLPLMNENDEGSEDGETETPADVAFAKTKRQEEQILQLIANTKVLGSTILDLSKKDLQTLPEEIIELSHIEYMYLEGNDIAFLPDEFFKFFPRLKWLDLRNNVLSRIPSIYLSNHQCLRNLLLEGNNLRNLPLELGLVKSLHGLNIAGNPLDFPPQEVIEAGTQTVLGFLRSMMEAKNTAKMGNLELDLSEEATPDFEQISASSDDWNTTASMMELAKRRQMVNGSGQVMNGSAGDHNYTGEEEYSIGAKSAELHRPVKHSESKYKHIQKLKKAGALGIVDKRRSLDGCHSVQQEVDPGIVYDTSVKTCLSIKSLALSPRPFTIPDKCLHIVSRL